MPASLYEIRRKMPLKGALSNSRVTIHQRFIKIPLSTTSMAAVRFWIVSLVGPWADLSWQCYFELTKSLGTLFRLFSSLKMAFQHIQARGWCLGWNDPEMYMLLMNPVMASSLIWSKVLSCAICFQPSSQYAGKDNVSLWSKRPAVHVLAGLKNFCRIRRDEPTHTYVL